MENTAQLIMCITFKLPEVAKTMLSVVLYYTDTYRLSDGRILCSLSIQNECSKQRCFIPVKAPSWLCNMGK